MTRTPKTVTKVVRVLGNPEPEYVSLVGRGANQEPFRKLKIDQPIIDMKKTAPQQKKVEKGTEAKAPAIDIHKFVFDKAKFETEDQVTTYLTEKGYRNFVVDDAEDAFVVDGIAEDQFDSVKPIAKDEGVVAYVGQLTEKAAESRDKAAKDDLKITIHHRPRPGETKREVNVKDGKEKAEGEETGEEGDDKGEEETSAKTAQVRGRTRAKTVYLMFPEGVKKGEKIDSYEAYYSESQTIAGVLDDAKDGMPVGFYDVNTAFMGALKNLVLTGKGDEIPALTQEFGKILQTLVTLTESATKEDKERVMETLLAPVPSDGVTTKKQSVKEGKEEASKGAEAPSELNAAIAKVLEPLLGQLKDIATKVAGLAEAKAEVAKVAGRVTRLEEIRQTPKSADTDEVTTQNGEEGGEGHKEEPKTKSEVETRIERNVWGA